jgi:Na+/phosphate symporter
MWKDTIRKNIFEEDPEEMTDFMNVSPRMKNEAEKRKDVSRKVRTLERMREQILEYYGIISSFEFQEGFPKDSAEDIAEAAELLEKVSDLMTGFMR